MTAIAALEIRISSGLKDLPVIDYRALVDMDKNPKELEKENYDRFYKSLTEQGQLAPFFIWIDPTNDKRVIVDGHQRKNIFLLCKVVPYERPYILVPGDTYEDAKKALLAISSNYGKMTQQRFNDFVLDIPEDWLKTTIHFDALSKNFEKSLKPVIAALPETIELKPFSKTHILISFPPEKLIEIEALLKPIIEKDYVEFEQGSN